jgi:cytochrome P450
MLTEELAALAADDGFDAFEEFDAIIRADGRNPYEEFTRCRRESPVRLVDAKEETNGAMGGLDNFYRVYRWADVTRVLRDTNYFSSAFYAESIELVFGRTILGMDPPVHSQYRALVATAFRQSVLHRWETTLIGAVVDELIDGFAAKGHADLVRELTFAFPANVIAEILGLPKDHYEQFQRWTAMMNLIGFNPPRGYAASLQLREYFIGFITERRADPRDDLISDLVRAEIDGQRLDDEEIVSYLRLLLSAGVETTSRYSATLLYALLTNREQLEAVNANRDLLPQAIEEGLRWEPPIPAIPRKCIQDVELGGQQIPAGSVVFACLASANRDEERYPDADRFDIFREPHQFMSFGWGPHMCLGMHLARLETKVAVNRVLDRLPNIRLDPDKPDEGITGTGFRSPRAVPVLFDPA